MDAQEISLKIADNMEKYGGSFVKTLSMCIRRADATNLMKLKEAFPEYFSDYHPSKWVKKNK